MAGTQRERCCVGGSEMLLYGGSAIILFAERAALTYSILHYFVIGHQLWAGLTFTLTLPACAVQLLSFYWFSVDGERKRCFLVIIHILQLGIYKRNLPDVTADDFQKVDLSQYKWIHWEGRNAGEQVKMIKRVQEYNLTIPTDKIITISVEIEKTRDELYQLFEHADVVFVSKDVARNFGYNSAAEALRGLYSRVRKGASLICAWAEKGADGMGPEGIVVHSDAFPPEAIVDTLGAGDTFNASVIFALSNGKNLQEALAFGCQTAGRKCGIQGYDGIVVNG